ncbi:AhpC/TSA family protein [Mucilaginibacter pallidiroseus]|uniref:AhpC/TSA family protein n=1 Tax=Mucilaginibacter pallidiroseus TaxID=2599295 RepID=A0A563TZJ5_9SPHI|nr:TlpA disulfide reductase family protein [Mucilaginibacter pallidiroseus]TWR24804.1 AhpC/TSA family protein [Mucilaginibacter pallidiroseus]
MKIVSLTIAFLCFLTIAIAQKKHAEPLIIQGRIANTTEKMLKIFFEDEYSRTTIDTIKINNDGTFYLKTYHITKPQRTSLQQNSLQINKIYVAPGYNLTITGDATDYLTLFQTKRITGIGSETNAYRQKVDSMLAARNDRTEWYSLKLDDLLKYIRKTAALNDSIFNVVFNKQPKQDKYFNTFKRLIKIDEQSLAYYMVLQHLEMGKYTYQQMDEIAKQNLPPIFKAGISRDEYLESDDYKSWIVPLYFALHRKMDLLKDSMSVKQPDYVLNTVNKLYTGKVRDKYLYWSVNSRIRDASSIEQLNKAKKASEKTINSIKDANLKGNLNSSFKFKEDQLMLVQAGQPAPSFNLPSDKGQLYTVEGFKGKVVYIDLWASWCGPCRQEMPNFKKLSESYKGNGNITFVSIAVFDGERDWRKALSVEQPTWLQLYDNEGKVARSYVANAIPKYIIIDKDGKVANFNAPGPGSAEIKTVLDKELAK